MWVNDLELGGKIVNINCLLTLNARSPSKSEFPLWKAEMLHSASLFSIKREGLQNETSNNIPRQVVPRGGSVWIKHRARRWIYQPAARSFQAVWDVKPPKLPLPAPTKGQIFPQHWGHCHLHKSTSWSSHAGSPQSAGLKGKSFNFGRQGLSIFQICLKKVFCELFSVCWESLFVPCCLAKMSNRKLYT